MPGSPPRVRFAPSPTGYFHVGSARTALFNWLVARQAGGAFVLRIEDTDAERSREEWIDGIVTALEWLGLDFDEGPIRQSTRADRYRRAEDALWDGGRVYACDCTHDEVEARRKAAGRLTPGYDGFCRDRGLPRGQGAALRFRTPDEGTTVVDDVVRGEVVFPNEAIDDFVVVKGNGAPLFVLANVVDDIDMAISHVIRGEDLLPTTPRGILVWQALADVGWTTEPGGGALGGPDEASPVPALPVFAHLPMLVNEQRKKLSKRRDPVSVESYRDQGFLADAFVNYLALLGWAPPTGEEIFDRAHLLDWFRLEDVNHAPAFFDVAKLTHMNGEYVRALRPGAFVEVCQPWLTGAGAPWPPEAFDEAVFVAIAPLVQERVATLDEVPAMVDFLFLEEPAVDEAAFQKAVMDDAAAAADILSRAIAAYSRLEEWD
ncbi:MAG: glutamate--tRNA ligase, partial [Acidimicrobiales bacterium]|nr:glutamate--tRNA ligase [Acidimicrobiales bacterium]